MKEDAPFIAVALAFHGLLLVANPGILWKAPAKAAEKILEVGFVTVPPTGIAQSRAPLTAGIAPGGDSPEPEAAVPAAPAPVKAKSVKKAVKKPLSPEQIARRRERAQIREVNRRLAAARRQAAELARQERLEAQALARQERIRMIAEARARETARKAEISRTLAALPSPDEALSAAQPEMAGGNLAAAGMPEAGQDLRDAPNAGGAEAAGGNGRIASGAGVELEIEGSAAGRRLLNRPTPNCPEWVSRRGLELAVAVRFVVMDSGAVKEGILVTQTSGFPDLDKLVLAAVRKWKFERMAALAGRGKLEQWGLVTFKFLG